MIIVLSHDTIVRILDHATTTSGAASKVGSRRAPSPLPSKAGPALSKSIIDALSKPRRIKPISLDHSNRVSSTNCRRGVAASA